MRWRSLIGPVVVTAVLGGLGVLFVWQVRNTEPADFVLPVAIPVVIWGVAGLAELQVRIGRWAWRRSAARPRGQEVADYDEGEVGESAVRKPAATTLGYLRGCGQAIVYLPLVFSPGLASLVVTGVQHEKAQYRAITRTYGEAVYANGVRIDKRGMLTTGFPAHPDAVAIVRYRSHLPEIAALLLTLPVADWLLRRYYGEGYNGKRPLIDLGRLRRGRRGG